VTTVRTPARDGALPYRLGWPTPRAFRDGEDRPAYLDRLEGIGRREWTELSATEFAEGIKHVRTCDLPETVSGWERLGLEAGFSSLRELYKSPTDLFRLFLYRP